MGPLRARHRLVRRSCRRSPAPTRAARSSTARSTTSTPSAAWAAGLPHRRRGRRRAARPRGGQRPAPARPRGHRRRVRAPADGRAARRRRRPRRCAATSRPSASPCAPAPPPPRCAPTRDGVCVGLAFADGPDDSTPTSSCSPPASAPRPARPRRRARRGRARRRRRRRRLRDRRRRALYAIGEVACHGGRAYGLVAPGYAMAEVVADRIAGGDATFTGADLSTRLKLLGVEVASRRRPARRRRRGRRRPTRPPVAWQKVVLDDERPRARRRPRRRRRRRSPPLVRAFAARSPTPDDLVALLAGAGRRRRRPAPADLPDEARLHVPQRDRRRRSAAAVGEGSEDVAGDQGVHQGRAPAAAPACPLLQELIDAELRHRRPARWSSGCARTSR